MLFLTGGWIASCDLPSTRPLCLSWPQLPAKEHLASEGRPETGATKDRPPRRLATTYTRFLSPSRAIAVFPTNCDIPTMSNALRLLTIFEVFCLLLANAAAVEPSKGINAFLESSCVGCHEGSGAEGGLDLTQLGVDLTEPANLTRWVRIFDRVDDGEMPPQDGGELDPDEAATFLRDAAAWLSETQQGESARLGRVRSRRLTNVQLERTLHDLFAIDVPLASLMPEEQRTDGFTNIADGQSMSHFQLESHLSVIDEALEAALNRIVDSDQGSRHPFSARALARKNPRQRCRDPEMIDGKAVVWSSGLIFYGRITSTMVRQSGWYRITFSASAMNKPGDHGVWCTVRSGQCTSGAPLMSWIGSFEATDEPTERTFEAWIPAGHMLEIRPGDETLKRARFNGGQVGAGEGGPQDVPGVALHSMSIEEIHPGGSVELVQRRLFGELNIKVDRRVGRVQLVSDEPAEDAAGQLRAFAARAFRRPTSDQELRPYLGMLEQAISTGENPIDALLASYRAILCSPRFLYFVETPGPLDDDAIATRLSYLLWNSMPDDELMSLAQTGRLRDTENLHQQVERMLAGPRGRKFVEDFAGQWLDLVDIDFTEPDRKLYRDFDIIVQNAMLDETHQFLHSLLESNGSATRLVAADFTFLNSRLARFYDIDGVDGEAMRRVTLPAGSHRGGLLAQGSILKVTANGTNTSPVLRGVWVSERVLGTPIPPPPASVPAVEPDIRGATTIREQLQKHLSDTVCAGCHYKIDPPGYALENFDAAGRWRDAYLGPGKDRSRRGTPIDSGFTMPDGRTFHDFEEFRTLLCRDPRPIAANFAEKLLVYGTGASISFVDRRAVDAIVDQTADSNYGLRSLLHAVVASTTFLSK